MKTDIRSSLFNLDGQRLTEKAETIKLNESVPDFVKQRFNNVKKLIICSHLHYEFKDVAFEYSLLTVEGAIKTAFMRDHDYKLHMDNKKGKEIKVTTFRDLRDAYFSKDKFRLKEKSSFCPTLSNLIEWAKENYNLDLNEIQLWGFKTLRNEVAAHPDEICVHTPSIISLIKKNADFINTLFP